jgi:DNA mismatch endonuclease (patch repair protein)
MSKVPRYQGMAPASEKASLIKKNNRKTGGKAEILLRKELWSRGFRYRIHVRDLDGKPDLVFYRERIAIFVDGDFWHGRDWITRRKKLERSKNSDYWIKKIEYNMARDLRVTANLELSSWTVLRVWEGDIFSKLNVVLEQVVNVVTLKKLVIIRNGEGK